ncbi:spore germination protein GerPC [Bacillus massilinigeriensis]|uniref:spore germination protein GerPC n=1 Tax=Bacillus mediterraneensis TaxID=1805474 RepID=UPI0008F92E45|nr:spore germination protein GerPC [Bacillus mediterraneensis]
MNLEIYQYLAQLHSFVQQQSEKISKLERTVKEMRKEMKGLKERPPMQVGNIEYKFDQLKVERLEGTLSIGLNPSDLQGLEDFSVDNKQVKAPSPKDMFYRSMDIEQEISTFIDTEVPAIFHKSKDLLGIEVDDSYLPFIQEDLKRQIPNRIAAYTSELPEKTGEGKEETVYSNIIIKLKTEIENGIHQFLQNLP